MRSTTAIDIRTGTGPDSGGTDLTFYVPILPLIDIAGYFAFIRSTTADTPIDSVVIRFSAISSEFVEYEPAQMKSVDLSKDNYLFVTTPPLQADKAYDVSLSINGQDFWPYNTTSDDECFMTQVGLEKHCEASAYRAMTMPTALKCSGLWHRRVRTRLCPPAIAVVSMKVF